MRDFNKIATSIIDSHNFKISDIQPSVWAEANRIMTTDVSSYPGKFSYSITPYVREIIDCLSAENPARIIAIMKGAQIGMSTGLIENGIGWIIDQAPAPIILMSGDKELSKEIIEKRVDQMIDSCGLRNQIRPNSLRHRNQRTGDTTASKEFAGGYLIADGANNANKLRQRSLMYGFIDDFESAPKSDKKSGSIRILIEQRFASYFQKMKLFYISTPEIKQTSNIEPVFELGDKRYYHVPCPCCGELIVFHWRINSECNEGENAGIQFKLDDKGKLIEDSVEYLCQKCGKSFKEQHKQDMLQQGKWIPTAEPSEIGYYSYHLSALYAPVGMYNWTHYVRMFLDCYPNGLDSKADTAQLKTFVNVVLGQTYEERSKTPAILQLSQNTRQYKIGEVPNELSQKDSNGKIVMLTCACDLNGKIDDARLDYEVVAWAESGVSYSVDIGSIGTFQRGLSEEERQLYTYRNNEPLNIWDIFLKDVLQKIYISDDKKRFIIHVAGIDTGYFTHYAYNFIESNAHLKIPLYICGIKGEIDKIRRFGVDTNIFRISKEKHNLYILEVNQIKDDLADRMELRWHENSGLTQPMGFMNFPEPMEGKYTMKNYFNHFKGESKIPFLNSDGTAMGHRWAKKNSMSENHFWDCRVYNLALKEIWVDVFLKSLKIKYPDWAQYCAIMKTQI